jgi:hypothetical protein
VILGRFRSGEVDQFLHTLRSRPPNFFASYVKTLVLTSVVNAKQAARIMSVCTGVVNFASSVPCTTLVPTPNSFHPQRLSINLGSRQVADPDFSLPLFANVTHLEIVTKGTSWSGWSGFENLHRLTHLAVSFQGDARLGTLDVLHQILASCSSLKVLVVIAHNDYISRATLDLVQDHFSDPRVAFIREEARLQDWLRGLDGGRDMWERAEELVMVQSGSI